MASTVPAPNPTPTIKIVDAPFADDVVAPAGATFKLEGGGWPANTLIQLEVCGNEARSGSAELLARHGADRRVDCRRIVSCSRVSVVPPSACPCVVRAVSQANGFVAAAPVDIPGAPIEVVDDGDVIKPLVRNLDVESASLQGSDSWGAWIGGHPQRGLVFTVVNTGDVALTDATVSLSVGTSEDPTGFVAPVSLGRLEVDRRRPSIPVEFEALSFGKLVVKGNITGTTEQTTFTSDHDVLSVDPDRDPDPHRAPIDLAARAQHHPATPASRSASRCRRNADGSRTADLRRGGGGDAVR